MILTHGSNSISRGFNYGSVTLGGETYKTLNYNGTIWTVENIRNDIPSNYIDWDLKYGRLYKYYDAVNTIKSMLTDGWRVPLKKDFDDLVAFLGNDYLSYISQDFGGTNANGFNVPLTGYVSSSGAYLRWNVYGIVWADTVSPNTPDDRYDCVFGLNTIIPNDTGYATSNSKTKNSVRLCKDA